MNRGGKSMNEDIEFDLNKFKAVVHYIVHKCGFKDNVGRTVLHKLLYFSDFNFYELKEIPITGEKYVKKSRGPVPIHFNQACMELKNEGKITIAKQESSNHTIHKYSSTLMPDTSLLNEDELKLINSVIDELSDLYSMEISKYSHGDLPWRLAKNDKELNYEAVFYREPEYSVRKYS